MAAAKKTTKKSTKKSSKAKASARAKTSVKKTSKKAVKKTVKKAATAAPVSTASKSNEPMVSGGAIIFAVLILAIGVVGWLILVESDKINDEYDIIDETNTIQLQKPSAPAEPAVETTEEAN